MLSERIEFPKRRSDGSAVVEVDLSVPGLETSRDAARLSSWTTGWLSSSTFTILDKTFDPQVDLVRAPEATAYPGGLVITLHLREGHTKLWKDWFILHVLPSLQAVIPGAVVQSFRSPEEQRRVPSA